MWTIYVVFPLLAYSSQPLCSRAFFLTLSFFSLLSLLLQSPPPLSSPADFLFLFLSLVGNSSLQKRNKISCDHPCPRYLPPKKPQIKKWTHTKTQKTLPWNKAMLIFQCDRGNEDSLHSEVPVGQQKWLFILAILDYLPSASVFVKESTDH